MLVSASKDITQFAVLDPNVNFSEHLPLFCNVIVSTDSDAHTCNNKSAAKHSNKPVHTQLRWDKAGRAAYYLNTGYQLQPYVVAVRNIFIVYEAGNVSVE